MRVELSVHAAKLKNVAGAFKGTSDPFAVCTMMPAAPGEKPRVLGKTEVIKNNLNPQWVTSFELDYEMGTPCKVAINIFDEIRKGDNKSMGSAVFDIGEVLGESRVEELCPAAVDSLVVRTEKKCSLLWLDCFFIFIRCPW